MNTQSTGSVIFAASKSMIASHDASETIVLHLRGGYHGADGCGVRVYDGLHQLSLLIAPCARRLAARPSTIASAAGPFSWTVG